MPVVDFSDEEFLIVEHYLRAGVCAVSEELCGATSSRETREAAKINRAADRLATEFREWWNENQGDLS